MKKISKNPDSYRIIFTEILFSQQILNGDILGNLIFTEVGRYIIQYGFPFLLKFVTL